MKNKYGKEITQMRPGFPFLGARYSFGGILMHSRPSFFPEEVLYPSGLWTCNFAKTTTMIPRYRQRHTVYQEGTPEVYSF